MPVLPYEDTRQAPYMRGMRESLEWAPDFSEVLESYLKIENSIGSSRESNKLAAPEFEPVEDYDPIEEVLGTPYERHWMSFVTSRSPQETQFIRQKIDFGMTHRETMGKAGLGANLAAGLIAGTLDPVNWLIGIGAYKAVGSSIARGLGVGARVGAAQAAVTEGILHFNQPERSAEESLLNLGLNTALSSGFVGATVFATRGMKARAAERTAFREAMENSVDEEMRMGTTAGFTGQHYPGWTPERAGERRHAPGVGNPTTPGPRPLAGTTGTLRPSQHGFEAYGFERFAGVVSPQARVINSPLRAASKAMEALATTPQFLRDNFRNVKTDIPVTEAVKRHRWTLAELIGDVDSSWMAYRLEKAGKNRDPKFGEQVATVARDKVLGTADGELSLPKFREEITRVLRRAEATGKIEHDIPQLAQMATKIRKTIDDMGDEAVQVGLLRPEDVRPNHVPRMWEQSIVMSRRVELADRIMAWQRDNLPESARDAREALNVKINRILSSIEGLEEVTPHEFESKKGIFKERTINVADDVIEDFLVNDIDHVMRSYMRLAAADIEITRKFGDLDMTDTIAKIEAEATTKADQAGGGKTPEGTKILEKAADDIKTLRAVRDVIRGVYELPSDPYSIPSRAARLLLDFNNLTMLGGATLASLPDIGRAVMVNGFEPTFQAIKPLITDFNTWKVAAAEVKMAGTALDMPLQTRALALAMGGDLPQRYTGIEKYAGYATNAFFIANMLSPWNAFMKQAVGIGTAHRILGLIGQDVRGTISPKNRARLRAAFIGPEESRAILAAFDEHGEMVNGLRMPNTQLWEGSAAARETFRRALARDVDVTIVTPDAGDLPLFSYKIWGRILLQYKSFVAASLNRVLIPGIQMKDAQTLFGMMMMTFIGGLVTMLRDKQNGVPTTDSVTGFILDGIDQSGATSWFFAGNNVVEALSGNRFGVRPALGAGPWWDTSARWKIGSLLGPSASQALRAGEIMADIASGEADWRTRKSFWRLIPGNNLFWLRMGNVVKFNEWAESINQGIKNSDEDARLRVFERKAADRLSKVWNEVQKNPEAEAGLSQLDRYLLEMGRGSRDSILFQDESGVKTLLEANRVIRG